MEKLSLIPFFFTGHQAIYLSSPLGLGDGDAHGREQVEDTAGLLQVALHGLQYSQLRQVGESPEFCHPVLRGAEGADPSAEEDIRQQNGGQQPGAHILGAGDEAQIENETGHEDELYKETQNLNFVKFLLQVSVFLPDFSEINQKLKFALFF